MSLIDYLLFFEKIDENELEELYKKFINEQLTKQPIDLLDDNEADIYFDNIIEYMVDNQLRLDYYVDKNGFYFDISDDLLDEEGNHCDVEDIWHNIYQDLCSKIKVSEKFFNERLRKELE